MATCLSCNCTFTPTRHSSGKFCGQACYQSQPKRRISPVLRFWQHVRKTESCWLWTGANDGRKGYGKFTIASGSRRHTGVSAHRFSYELHHGQIPKGLEICHHCDTPPCVRPDHLFAGTRAENIADATRKGRMKRPDNRGQRHGMSKLTEKRVKIIRRLFAEGASNSRLASRFNISPGAISGIVHRHSWKHVS